MEFLTSMRMCEVLCKYSLLYIEHSGAISVIKMNDCMYYIIKSMAMDIEGCLYILAASVA